MHGFDHCRKECCPFKHEKQKLLSTTSIALCSDIFEQDIEQHVSLQKIHLSGFVGRAVHPTVGVSALDIEANTFRSCSCPKISIRLHFQRGSSHLLISFASVFWAVVEFRQFGKAPFLLIYIHGLGFLHVEWQFLYFWAEQDCTRSVLNLMKRWKHANKCRRILIQKSWWYCHCCAFSAQGETQFV